MIQSFKDEIVKDVFEGRKPRRFPADLYGVTRRKLAMVDVAAVLEDLRVPPCNRLEALAGDRAGQHSIRVNDQYRICFTWGSQGPEGVEFVDYH